MSQSNFTYCTRSLLPTVVELNVVNLYIVWMINFDEIRTTIGSWNSTYMIRKIKIGDDLIMRQKVVRLNIWQWLFNSHPSYTWQYKFGWGISRFITINLCIFFILLSKLDDDFYTIFQRIHVKVIHVSTMVVVVNTEIPSCVCVLLTMPEKDARNKVNRKIW